MFLKKVEKYVTDVFQRVTPIKFLYHNLEHTKEVVEGCTLIGNGMELTKSEHEKVQIAAWFHDFGYIFNMNNHEERSAQEAEKFLSHLAVPSEKIQCVKELILSTAIKRKPNSLLEEVLKDSDLLTLGTEYFFKRGEYLRKEWELCEYKEFSDVEWMQYTYDFLLKHRFHTPYAKKMYSEQKSLNVEKAQKLLRQFYE